MNDNRDLTMKDAAIFVAVYFCVYCVAGTLIVMFLRALNAIIS